MPSTLTKNNTPAYSTSIETYFFSTWEIRAVLAEHSITNGIDIAFLLGVTTIYAKEFEQK